MTSFSSRLMETLELLQQVRSVYSQRKIAQMLDVSPRTVRRWENGECTPPLHVADSIKLRILPFRNNNATEQTNFTFIDLFAGIGGTRLGFESIGGKCLFTSEWNKFSVETYLENFPSDNEHQLVGDITQIDAKAIPEHDVLVAGFPCQPFSIAGVSKKASLGRPHGFECATQGTLFFDVARIIAEKRPKAFLLENVKNLVSHDKGNTFKIIKETLENELGYQLHHRIIDGQHFSPQHRERIIIVGFREPTNFNFDNIDIPDKGILKMESILHPQNGSERIEEPFTQGKTGKVNPKYTLSEKLWSYLQGYAEKHRKAGNGFGYGLVTADDTCRTLSARYYKDGSEILISQGKNKCPRRLTPRECSRLMGFPENYKIPVSDTQAYKQFGNSVVVPVIKAVAAEMLQNILLIKTNNNEALSK